MGIWRTAWTVVTVVLAMVVAAALGLLALLAAAARWDRPPVFLGVGLVVFLAADVLGVWLATRRLRAARGGLRWIVVGSTGVVAVVFFAVTALRPMGDPRQPPAAVPGQSWVALPTGSRLAYVHLPAAGPARATPVIVLHGGPGVPDMKGDAAYFGQLRRDGFEVYVYDQVGSGRSSRLADPRGYTLERDVADLEAFRHRIGREQVVLVGHSYGGRLAAAYAARHGGHVARMALTSPDELSPDAGPKGFTGRLPPAQQMRVYAAALYPRALLAYLLLQVNPPAAKALASDAELDARFDTLYRRSRAGLHCAHAAPGPILHGLGFFANGVPQSPQRARSRDDRPALARSPVPTLIVKGNCDYLSWSSGVEYRDLMPDARLIYFPGAGHNVYQDRPADYLAVLRAFLTARPLPVPAHTGERVPADYEGPR